MHADLLILQICDFLDDGDGIYRLHEPSRFLARLPGVVVIDCHYYHHLLPRLIESADVLILQFFHNWDFLPFIDQRRQRGQVTVFEANDNFYDVQPWNPIAEGWRDQAIQEEYRKYMRHCDAVQTSADFLAGLWKPFARKVAVFPNQLPEIPPLTDPPDRPLTIGWGGSPGHFADWYAIVPLLRRWLADHPDVHLAVMNNDLAKPFFDLPPDRYHFTSFGTLHDYLRFLPSLDIGLAPLLPTGYNRGRSDVKFLEYAMSGVPGIYADLEPYRATVQNGQTGFLYSTGDELISHINELATSPDLRRRIRRNAHELVSQNRRLDRHISERLSFYRSLFTRSPKGADLPPEILSAAEIEGNYLRLRPGEAERAFIAATARNKPPEIASAVAAVAQRFPDFHHALLHHGRHLNDARRYADALAVLRRVQEISPLSAAVLCELARAHYLLNDFSTAQAAFEKALEINPDFHPGWQYFLRFLRHTRRAGATDWAQKARQQFPNDFGIALLAIALHPPATQIELLGELLGESSARPHPDDFASPPVFAAAVSEALKSTGPTPAALAMLGRACEVFPESARLADIFARALFAADKIEESHAQYRRALHLRHVARSYQADYPRDDGSHYYWQFAEHIEEHKL
ncbi:MAG TPA: glycosyltransferase [Tepidisphaeraceae bacterium]|nr:glycosyltransferase [Tepidisphaeraceae bacterium]